MFFDMDLAAVLLLSLMHICFEQTLLLLWPYCGHEHCDSVDDEKLHVAATHSGDWVLAPVSVW